MIHKVTFNRKDNGQLIQIRCVRLPLGDVYDFAHQSLEEIRKMIDYQSEVEYTIEKIA